MRQKLHRHGVTSPQEDDAYACLEASVVVHAAYSRAQLWLLASLRQRNHSFRYFNAHARTQIRGVLLQQCAKVTKVTHRLKFTQTRQKSKEKIRIDELIGTV